jgi:uncharacterized repeat protein (TIGR01451 family)
VTSLPVLQLTKTGPAQVRAGDEMVYRLEYRNTGSDTATGVVLTDPVPEHTTFVSTTGGGVHDSNTGIVTWDLLSVPAGDGGIVTMRLLVDNPLADGTVITNSAELVSLETGMIAANASTTVLSEPLLVLDKSSIPAKAVLAGEQVSYTIKYRNDGTDTAFNTVLTDTPPIGMSLLSMDGGGSFDPATGTLTWNLGDIGAGQHGFITLNLKVPLDTPNNRLLVNSAAIKADNHPTVSRQHKLLVLSTPQLELTKTGPDKAAADTEFTYTIDYYNSGNASAVNALLVDHLPKDVEFISASGNGTESSGSVTWNLGNIPPLKGGSVTLTVSVKSPLPNGTRLVNSAEITAGNAHPESAGLQTTVTSRPVLSLTKSAPAQVAAGDSLLYTLHYENTGSDIATGLALTDTLPANTVFKGATGGGAYDPASNTVTWSLGDLDPGDDGAVTFTVEVATPLADHSLINNQAGLSSAETQPVSASASTTVLSAPIPVVTISSTPANVVEAGEQVTFTIDYRNDGNDLAKGVLLVNQLPAGLIPVSIGGGGVYNAAAGTVTWTIGDHAAGSPGSVGLTARVPLDTPDGRALVNTVTYQAQNVPDVSAQQILQVSSAPVLGLIKFGPAKKVPAGSEITYTLFYENSGNATATNVVLTDQLPRNIIFSSASAGGAEAAGLVTWNLGDLGPQQSGSVVVKGAVATPLSNGTKLVNTAHLDAANSQAVTQSLTTTVTSRPILGLTKTAPAQVKAGSRIVYTLRYENLGTDQATNLLLTDTLPPNTSFVSADGGGSYDAATRLVSWDLASLDAGAHGSVTLSVDVASPLADGTKIINVAGLTSAQTAPVQAQAVTNVSSAPVLSVSKVSNPVDVVSAGADVKYTITYRNTGTDLAAGVVLTDSVPDGINVLAIEGNGVFDPATRLVTWNIGDLDAGVNKTVSVTLEIPLDTPDGTLLVNTAFLRAANAPSASAQKKLVVTGEPVLELEKTGPASVAAGGTMTYRLTYANSGNETATGVMLEDTLPKHASFVSATGGGIESGGKVRWMLGNLPPLSGDTVEITLIVGSPLADGTILNNSGSLTAGNAQPVTDTARTTIFSYPALALTVTAPGQVQAGDQLSFQFRLENNGTDAAAPLVMLAQVPPGATFVSETGGGVYDPVSGLITWVRDELAAGANELVTVVVDIAPQQPDHSTLTWPAAVAAGNAPVVSAEASTTVLSKPVLRLTKSSKPDKSVDAGQPVEYIIDYRNDGSGPAVNAVLTDLLPSGTTIASIENGGIYDPTAETVTWNLGNISSGTSGQVKLRVLVPINTPDQSLLVNTASIDADNASPVMAVSSLPVSSKPLLTLTKTGPANSPAGSVLSYILSFENHGNAPATGAVLTDRLPDHTRVLYVSDGGMVSGRTVSWDLGDIKPFEPGSVVVTLQIDAPIPNGTLLTNSADLTADQIASVSRDWITTVTSSAVLDLNLVAQKQVLAGGQVLYLLEYRNTGTDSATNVVLTNTLPEHVSLAGQTGGGIYDSVARTVTWNLGSLAAGATGSVSLLVNVDVPLPNQTVLTNTAVLDSDQTGPVIRSSDTVVESAPILTLVKRSRPADLVQAGERVVYTIEFGNSGTADALDVGLTDTLPSGMQISYISSGGVYDPATGKVVWNIGTLAPGQSGSVTLRVLVPLDTADDTLLRNSAEIAASNAPVSQVSTPLLVASAPRLELVKQGPATVRAGESMTYTLHFKNAGNATATQVRLTDLIPAHTRLTSASAGGVQTGNSVVWTLHDLAPQAEGSVEMTVMVDSPLADGTLLVNTALLDADNAGQVSRDLTTKAISQPQLELTKTGPSRVNAGGRITYSLNFANTGTDTASKVVLRDDLPAGTVFSSASGGGVYNPGNNQVVWNLGKLDPGASKTVSIIVDVEETLADQSVILNRADLRSLETGPVSASASTTVSSIPDLVLIKKSTPDKVAPADSNVTYTLEFQNQGSGPALNVVLTDALPAGAALLAISGGGVHDPASNTVTWNLGDLPVGSPQIVTVTVHAPSSLASNSVWSNIASLDADNSPPVSAQNSLTITSQPRLELTKTAPANVNAGATITYTLKASNAGTGAAENASVTDPLPAGTSFISATSGGSYDPATRTVTWSLGSLLPKKARTLTLLAGAPVSAADQSVVLNTATLTSSSAQPTTAQASTVISSVPAPGLVLRSAPAKTVDPGKEVLYTIEYRNDGSAPATAAKLMSALPAGTTPVSIGAGGVYDPNLGVITWNLGNLPAGSSQSLDLKVLVAPGTPSGSILTSTVTLQPGNAAFVTDEITLTVSSQPRLQLSKTGPATVQPAQEISYVLHYANIGNSTVPLATIVDTLPEHVTFLSASDGGVYEMASNTVTWELVDLQAGSSGMVSVNVVLDTPLAEQSIITNTANLDSAVTEPVRATATSVVGCIPDLEYASSLNGAWAPDDQAIVIPLADGTFIVETTFPVDERMRFYRLRLCEGIALKPVSMAVTGPGTLAIEFHPVGDSCMPVLEAVSSLNGTWEVDTQATVMPMGGGIFIVETPLSAGARIGFFRLRLCDGVILKPVSTTLPGPGILRIRYEQILP